MRRPSACHWHPDCPRTRPTLPAPERADGVVAHRGLERSTIVEFDVRTSTDQRSRQLVVIAALVGPSNTPKAPRSAGPLHRNPLATQPRTQRALAAPDWRAVALAICRAPQHAPRPGPAARRGRDTGRFHSRARRDSPPHWPPPAACRARIFRWHPVCSLKTLRVCTHSRSRSRVVGRIRKGLPQQVTRSSTRCKPSTWPSASARS